MSAAVIVAAGTGERMGAGMPKALVPVGGRPLLAWSLDAFVASPRISSVVVVGPPSALAEVGEVVGGRARVVAGGTWRAESVRLGLAALSEAATHVLVHDAARPLVSAAIIDAVLDALAGCDGAIAASPVADTLKRGDAAGRIAETVDRAGLWAAQTPQGFRLERLLAAYARLPSEHLASATDCASIMEAAGEPVALVPAAGTNLKVTRPEDVALAEHLLRLRGDA